jgi:hypothetical protein
MKKLLLTAFTCVCALPSLAQAPMVKGYLVTEKGDTLQGEVKPNKKELDNYIKVTFKDANGVQKIYKPTKTKGYGTVEGHYISMDSEDEKKFYKVLAIGAINFYKLGYEAMRMNEIVFEAEYYISHPEDKELFLIKESKFKKQLGEWMKDNPEFIEAYGDEKKFDIDKAVLAITNYNSWKAGQAK